MARVIRNGGAVVPAEVLDARAHARRIVADAEAKARRLVEEAEAGAAAMQASAHATGRAEAEAAAAALLVAAARRRDEALAEAEGELVDLALAAARHIIGEELELAPARVTSIVHEVLSRARRAKRVRLRIHPSDVARLSDTLPGVDVAGDETLARGGCVVETDLGQLDGRLEVRLETLRRALRTDPP